MSSKSAIGLLTGLAIIGGLAIWQGMERVMDLLSQAGLAMLWLSLFAVPEQVLNSEAWRLLFPSGRRPGMVRTQLASWMGAAVNSLLPVATIGGEVVKARVLTLWGYPGVDAIATTVVDKTAQAITILLWGVMGIIVMTRVVDDSTVLWSAVSGAVLLALGIAGFIGVQLMGGVSAFARGAAKVGKSERQRDMIGGASELDEAIRALYRRPGAIIGAALIRLAARVLMVGQVVLAAWLMGSEVTWEQAVMLEGLVMALRGVSFAIPAGLGVQEGGYVAVGALVGLPADLMMAVSLATRLREIVPMIPFLFLWQHTEGRAWWERRETARAAAAIVADADSE